MKRAKIAKLQASPVPYDFEALMNERATKEWADFCRRAMIAKWRAIFKILKNGAPFPKDAGKVK